MATPAGILKCPVEILIKIMSNVYNLPSLFNLTEADEVFNSVFKTSRTSILLNVFQAFRTPPQLLQIMAGVNVFEYKDRSKMAKSFTVAVQDIELFVSSLIRICFCKLASSSVDFLPNARPSETEIYQIRRAFWRLKQFLTSNDQNRDCSSASIEWHSHLDWWEREEMECASKYFEPIHKHTPHQKMSMQRYFPGLFGETPEDESSWPPLTSNDKTCFWDFVLVWAFKDVIRTQPHIKPSIHMNRVLISRSSEYKKTNR